MNNTKIKEIAIPEMIGRRDVEAGPWEVNHCAGVRGAPMTNIVDKVMMVPVDPTENARHIRGHEMVHAKVSPADDWVKWLERGMASENALRSVEEARVNYLLKKAGFDPEKHLMDGSELAAGERGAELEDWAGCVYTAVGFMNSAGLKQFLNGVRRHNREWGEALRALTNQINKEFKKNERTLASTERDDDTGLAPLGFTITERIAEMVDRIANPPQDDEEHRDGEQAENGEPMGEDKKNPPKAPVDKDQMKKINPAAGRQPGAQTWATLKVGNLPLTRVAKGAMGKVRKATQFGRNPRRIERMLVDPEKRIFDMKKKGNGGVVLIDGSGSMHLETSDIIRIVEQAPGATVAVYSADRRNENDNLLILAKDGRMVEALPPRAGGNGVDGPALAWAIKQRQYPTAPVIFVTDGAVHGLNGGYDDLLAMDCIKQVLKHKVIVRETVDEAVAALKLLQVGRTPKRDYPYMWKRTWQKLNGRPLR